MQSIKTIDEIQGMQVMTYEWMWAKMYGYLEERDSLKNLGPEGTLGAKKSASLGNGLQKIRFPTQIARYFWLSEENGFLTLLLPNTKA